MFKSKSCSIFIKLKESTIDFCGPSFPIAHKRRSRKSFLAFIDRLKDDKHFILLLPSLFNHLLEENKEENNKFLILMHT